MSDGAMYSGNDDYGFNVEECDIQMEIEFIDSDNSVPVKVQKVITYKFEEDDITLILYGDWSGGSIRKDLIIQCAHLSDMKAMLELGIYIDYDSNLGEFTISDKTYVSLSESAKNKNVKVRARINRVRLNTVLGRINDEDNKDKYQYNTIVIVDASHSRRDIVNGWNTYYTPSYLNGEYVKYKDFIL